MPPSPAPTPIEVYVHSAPAEWWQVLATLGPLAVLLGAVLAGVIGWRTLKQKTEADNRAEWWRRTQWALDAAYSGDKKKATVGLKVLRVLGESGLAGVGELAVLEAASDQPLSRAALARTAVPPGQYGAEAEIPPAEPEHSPDDELSMRSAAAQLRELTDRRQGKVTPDWIQALARERAPDRTGPPPTPG